MPTLELVRSDRKGGRFVAEKFGVEPISLTIFEGNQDDGADIKLAVAPRDLAKLQTLRKENYEHGSDV